MSAVTFCTHCGAPLPKRPRHPFALVVSKEDDGFAFLLGRINPKAPPTKPRAFTAWRSTPPSWASVAKEALAITRGEEIRWVFLHGKGLRTEHAHARFSCFMAATLEEKHLAKGTERPVFRAWKSALADLRHIASKQAAKRRSS